MTTDVIQAVWWFTSDAFSTKISTFTSHLHRAGKIGGTQADRVIRAVKGSHNGREGLTHRIDHAARRFQKASKTMLRAVEAGCVVVTLDVVDVQNVWDNPGPRQRTSGLKDDVDDKTARAR